MDAIHCTFLKQSISLSDFGFTGLGHTHTPFLSFTVWYDRCVFLGSGFDTGHLFNQSLWQANICPQGTTTALYIPSFTQDKSCSFSSNWVWNQLSSYTFLCCQLINNSEAMFGEEIMCATLNNVWQFVCPWSTAVQPWLPRAALGLFSMCYNLWDLYILNLSHSLYNISHFCSHLSIFLRPSHWWRNTPSSKITSLCLMPSGWLRTTALKKHKKVSLDQNWYQFDSVSVSGADPWASPE